MDRIRNIIQKAKIAKNFGNARYIDNLFDKLVLAHALEATDENLKLYELYVKSADNLGVSIGHSFVGGASDGNKIAQNGVCVLDGLGAIGKGIHAMNEQVNIEVYLERIALLVALLMNIQ